MSIEQVVLEQLRLLPEDKQREALDFVEFLRTRRPSAAGDAPRTRRSLLGLGADLGAHVSDADIAEARREMWGHFPHHRRDGASPRRAVDQS